MPTGVKVTDAVTSPRRCVCQEHIEEKEENGLSPGFGSPVYSTGVQKPNR